MTYLFRTTSEVIAEMVKRYANKGSERKQLAMFNPKNLADRHSNPIFTGPIKQRLTYPAGYDLPGVVYTRNMAWGHPREEYQQGMPAEVTTNNVALMAWKTSQHRDTPGHPNPDDAHTRYEIMHRHNGGEFDQSHARNAADLIGDHYVAHKERKFKKRMAAGAAMDRGIHVHNADRELRSFHFPQELRDVILDKAFGPRSTAVEGRAHRVHRADGQMDG